MFFSSKKTQTSKKKVEDAENKNRIDDASIVTALQNLDLQYEQNVEELEVNHSATITIKINVAAHF